MNVGEARDMSGEAKSRSNIHLPGVQEELIKAIYATGKPVDSIDQCRKAIDF